MNDDVISLLYDLRAFAGPRMTADDQRRFVRVVTAIQSTPAAAINAFADKLADGWFFAYEPGTHYIGLNHPHGGKMSVLRIEYGNYDQEIGETIVAFLNGSAPLTSPATQGAAVAWQVRMVDGVEWVNCSRDEYEERRLACPHLRYGVAEYRALYDHPATVGADAVERVSDSETVRLVTFARDSAASMVPHLCDGWDDVANEIRHDLTVALDRIAAAAREGGA